MSRIAKLHLFSALYCGILIALNWSRTTQYARSEGVTSESVAPVALALILSMLVVVVLGWRVLRIVRDRLETGASVPPGRWIESWSVLIYALPLLWQNIRGSSWRMADGTIATTIGGFGSSLSTWVFLFAVAGLLLAQVEARLATR